MAYELFPPDGYLEPWVLWSDSNDRVAPRPEYADLICRSCGKLDEPAALQRGLPANLRVRTKLDFLGTGEEFGVIVSERFVTVIQGAGITGLQCVPLPSSSTHFFAVADRFVATDLDLAGFENIMPRCASCGRYRERVVGPLIRSLTIPSEPLAFFASTEWSESIRGRRHRLFATPELGDFLRVQRFKGLELVPAA